MKFWYLTASTIFGLIILKMQVTFEAITFLFLAVTFPSNNETSNQKLTGEGEGQ